MPSSWADKYASAAASSSKMGRGVVWVDCPDEWFTIEQPFPDPNSFWDGTPNTRGYDLAISQDNELLRRTDPDGKQTFYVVGTQNAVSYSSEEAAYWSRYSMGLV